MDRYILDLSLTLEYGTALADWDVSPIENFDRLFDAQRNHSTWCEEQSPCPYFSFNESLRRGDVSRATSMVAMFVQAKEFNGDLSTWNVGRVTSMESMFEGCHVFNRHFHNGIPDRSPTSTKCLTELGNSIRIQENGTA